MADASERAARDVSGIRRALKLHPESRCDAVAAIEVEVARLQAGSLVLRYVVTGKIGDLRLPPVVTPARADGLWKHTCFEAFVRAPSAAGYTEFNFAPSMEWAAYRFSAYREGMTVAREVAAPLIDVIAGEDAFELQAMLAFPDTGTRRMGLSAVIEEAGGRISYWAIAHPPGKPDFHHADCFALEFSPS